MKRRKNIFFWLLLIGIAGITMVVGKYFFPTSFPYSRNAQDPSYAPLSIGVVDINSIKEKSKVFQKFKEVLETLNATIHREVLEKETKLRAEFEQFKKRNEDAKEPTQEMLKQKAELDKKYASLEKTVRTRREQLDEEYTKGLVHIKQTLKEIMDDLGKAHGLKIILNKSIGDGHQMDQSIILFCNEGLDLTNEVIRRLDKQIPLDYLEKKNREIK